MIGDDLTERQLVALLFAMAGVLALMLAVVLAVAW